MERASDRREKYVRHLTFAAVVMLAVTTACGVAPVKDEAGPPKRHLFADPHGRPLAYTGGVCPFEGRHTHGYPPVPPEAFIPCKGAATETRAIYAYRRAHARKDSSCFIRGFHMHIEPPTKAVRWDAEHAAYLQADDADPGKNVNKTRAAGKKEGSKPHPCDLEPCAHRPAKTTCPEPP